MVNNFKKSKDFAKKIKKDNFHPIGSILFYINSLSLSLRFIVYSRLITRQLWHNAEQIWKQNYLRFQSYLKNHNIFLLLKNSAWIIVFRNKTEEEYLKFFSIENSNLKIWILELFKISDDYFPLLELERPDSSIASTRKSSEISKDAMIKLAVVVFCLSSGISLLATIMWVLKYIFK